MTLSGTSRFNWEDWVYLLLCGFHLFGLAFLAFIPRYIGLPGSWFDMACLGFGHRGHGHGSGKRWIGCS
jgi:hypothetical protein